MTRPIDLDTFRRRLRKLMIDALDSNVCPHCLSEELVRHINSLAEVQAEVHAARHGQFYIAPLETRQ